ncbi:hypothetical protein JX580_09265 [Thiomicrospira microaerophila]|uniref:transglycosylase SLT domain-containing protein n=1 Tax=Thiomicrospira microaerophila TaxID=406020 RepID=UPI00200BCB46|nr:hypothetical protein [Thiomicrospira microaerophila]UQB41848.1 hypothetical protein JX580_09265 [Thiomicrospira microaerophila]
MASQFSVQKTTSLTKLAAVTFVLALTAGCATKPPPASTHNNICQIIEYDRNWYIAAKKSEAKWGTPVATQKAFVHQESRFVHNARPPRPYALGFIPLPRKSSAYGFAQAQDPAWYDYQKATGNYRARRNNVHDALDFIGWYNSVSNQRNGISLNDPYNLYLAYHEGHGGYRRKTYNQKPWLLDVAKKVERQARMYDQQLKTCPSLPKRFCVWPFC